eukprot:UN23958
MRVKRRKLNNDFVGAGFSTPSSSHLVPYNPATNMKSIEQNHVVDETSLDDFQLVSEIKKRMTKNPHMVNLVKVLLNDIERVKQDKILFQLRTQKLNNPLWKSLEQISEYIEKDLPYRAKDASEIEPHGVLKTIQMTFSFRKKPRR